MAALESESDTSSKKSSVMGGQSPLTGPLQLAVEAHFPIAWSSGRQPAALLGITRSVAVPDWKNLGGVTYAFKKVV